MILQKLEKLKKYFENGDIPALHKHEVNPGLPLHSRENYLYFTLTCSLNFQRLSPNTWKSALATWNDSSTRFVFFPEKVVNTDTQSLKDALLKHKLALQPNKHIHIWQVISKTFHDEFDDDPRELFKRNDFDSMLILNTLQGTMKKQFPYLSGPKLSNYLLFILLNYTDLQLKNTHVISIIPDTHIMKATVELGLLSREQVNPKSVERVWQSLLKNTKYSPIDFHSILWNWSRNKFRPKV